MHTKNNLNNNNQTASPAGDQSAEGRGNGKPQLPTLLGIAKAGADALRGFIHPNELAVIWNACMGEEREFFRAKLVELGSAADNMPTVYETDGQGDQAVAWLHYFTPDCDWYITERDSEDEQRQACGLACVWESELGYIDIQELIEAGAELDLYWQTKTLAEIRMERAMSDVNYVGHPMHY